jgi:hypothetical protein
MRHYPWRFFAATSVWIAMNEQADQPKLESLILPLRSNKRASKAGAVTQLVQKALQKNCPVAPRGEAWTGKKFERI